MSITNHVWYDLFQAPGTHFWTWQGAEGEHHWSFSIRPLLNSSPGGASGDLQLVRHWVTAEYFPPRHPDRPHGPEYPEGFKYVDHFELHTNTGAHSGSAQHG